MRLSLRPYRPSDVPALFALDTVCFEAPFRFSQGAIRRFAEAGNAIVRLAHVEEAGDAPERLAGFCIVHLEQHAVGYVVTLDVAPEFRGRGVGPRLMQSVERAAADAGARTMTLHVWTGNGGAIRLYERLGYAAVREVAEFYGPGLDARVYRKALSGVGQDPAKRTEQTGEGSGVEDPSKAM